MKYKKLLFLATGFVFLVIYFRRKVTLHGEFETDGELKDLISSHTDDHLVDTISHLKLEVSELRRLAAKWNVAVKDVKSNLPVIYAITPTHKRPVQKAELTRLSQTLTLVPNFHWILVEDSPKKTTLVSQLLQESGLKYTHLNAPTPENWKLKEKDPNWKKPRGVLQRNSALQWLRDNIKSNSQHGVVYFLDDDNTYSLQLFEEMRYTRGVSVWPVGLVGGLMVESPKINTQGKVIGWKAGWRPERPFAIDMAGFAINLQLFISKPDAKFSFDVGRGYQETAILKHLATLADLEIKANNCTKIYVWHTRTEAPKLVAEKEWIKAGHPSDLGIEV